MARGLRGGFRASLEAMLAIVFVLCLLEPAGAINLVSGLGGDRGYGENVLTDNDDGSTSAIDITPIFGAAGLNFFGVTQLALYVNNNGNITFNGPTGQYTPSGITAASNPIIAAFFADVDTRGDHTPPGSNLAYYDLDPTNHTFTATWDLVGYYSHHVDKLNNFQIRLIGRPDQGVGDFDIEFRYQQLQWTTGDASGGSGGLGGTPARAGYSAGDGNPAHFYEFPESGDQAGMLALTNRTNVGTAGLFIFQVRSGAVTPPPTFTPSNTAMPAGTPTPSKTATVAGTPTPVLSPTCDAVPATAVNALGVQHDMTVTVRHGTGVPAVGVTVTAQITSGPNAGGSASGPTDTNGQHGFFYSSNTAGTDTIQFSGVVDGQPFSCSVTKTWVQPPPPCSVNPPSATNPTGTQHTVTATFKHGDNSPAPGVPVSISITSGPNAPLLADAVANASGQVVFSYTGGPNAGTDVIEFGGVVDGEVVHCSANKTWQLLPPPPCTVNPASDTNLVGTRHTVTATFKHGNGTLAAGASVSVSISSGPNAPLLADAVTNASGQVAFSYTGGPAAGTDTIAFGGIVDDQVVHCSATKTWKLPPPPCTISPISDTNPVGSRHTVTAVFRQSDGAPAAGTNVSISISSGPNSLLLADGVTNASGQVTFSYTGGPRTGTDVIEFGGVVDGEVVGCSATKTWVAAQPACKVIPSTAANRVGTQHVVTAVFQRANGAPATGVGVSIGVTAGPNALLLADAMTDRNGQVAFAYTGGPNTGTDFIDFAGVVDDEVVRCGATKTWVVGQPTCEASPTSDINPTGARHTATAIFRRGDGSPVSGTPVSISISTGPNALLLADGVTNASGQVGLSYTGGPDAGTDVIEFSGFIDDQVVRCSATKTWVAGQPRCDVFPTAAVNSVGSDHVVTALFRRANGAPAAGAGVSISISSGPNALLLADAVTNQSGFAALAYTGGPTPGTDVIEFSGVVDDQVVSCRATKTWIAAQPSCDALPTTAVNATGTRHTAVAIFRRGDGSAAAGAGVSISISSGPNALLLADAVTNGSGLVGLSYNGGPNTGTDVIEFAGFVDGQVVRCSATKTWVRAQPTCDVVPGSDVNPTGTNHTVTAIFRRGDGSPAAGAGASISIAAGPNALLLADAVTDGSGQVALSYTGGPNAGTDIIEFAGFVDGQVVGCSATKTWVNAQPTCSVQPIADVNLVGTQHTVTAVFRRGNGAPAAAAGVSISIPYGPNAPLLADAVTNASGQVALSYTGGPNAGTDVIEFAGFIDGQVVSCSATKTWLRAQPTCDVAPSTEVTPVGTGHTVTATFRRSNGSVAAGVGVAISIDAGPNALLLADAVSNASGQVALSYTGGPNPGTDVVEFSGFVDDQVVRCAATKTWVAAQPTCDAEPTTAVNPVGSQHTVTATFRRGTGAPAAATAVSINVTSGPNAPVHADAVTNAAGRVTFAYTGGANAGTDTITFSGTVDGQPVQCAAAKTWVVVRPSCEVVPNMAENPVGTDHVVTASFRRSNGLAAAGASVAITITSGPNAGMLADAVTDANGQVRLTYTGGLNAGTDSIEFSSFFEGQVVRCSGTKTWVAPLATCDAAPVNATNPVGSAHRVTATFRRGNGAPAAATSVSISITSGPNAGTLADAVTNANGQVMWTYTGGPNAGTDVIEFGGVVDGQTVSCSANKTWGAARPTCETSPAAAVNRTGSQHAATAIFRHGDGSPVVATGVAINIDYGPNAPLHADAVTSSSGQVAFTYTGGPTTGTDVIEFSGTVDGQPVSCSANKTWVVAQPTCEVGPATATNTVGTQHAVTAIFRRGDGSPGAGVSVTIDVANGPNAPLQSSAATDSSGQVAFSYTGGPNTGTDVIEFSGVVDGQATRCSATKSWSAPEPTCEVLPSTAANPVGTRHNVTAIFRKGNGSVAAGVRVTIGVTSAAGSPLLPTALTDASGQVAFSYVGGSAAGTDVIEFSGVVDGQLTRCSATKTWVVGQPTCDAVPATGVNAAGTQSTATVTFRSGDGSPAAAVDVAVSITSGPNAPMLASALTDASGRAGFSYASGANAGTDVVEFSGVVDGQVTRCSATRTWTVAQGTCDVTPASAVNPAGTRHTMTATFRRGNGTPAAGVNVSIDISDTARSPLLSRMLTDANGQVSFSYTGGANASSDVIEFSGVVDGQAVRCSANKTWGAAQPTCEALPATDVNLTGTQHTVTATLRKADGSLVAGANVAINIGSGPNALRQADGVSNASGQVAFTYTGGSNTGTDVIEFSSFVDGQDVRCSATKSWAQTLPSPTRTATPTATPTASPGGCVTCVGDCGCDGGVTVDEIVTMVNIALGNADVVLCLPGDANADRLITVDEIISAVNNALNGCFVPTPTATPPRTSTRTPGTVTPTPTRTSTAATPGGSPTRTSTPTTTPATPPPTTGPSIGRRAAGTTVTLTQGLRVIPAIISALSPIAKGGGSSASDGSAAAVKSCTVSGTYDFTCTQAVPMTPPRNYSLTLSSCSLNTTPGTTVTLSGGLTGTSTETGFLATCSFPPLALSTLAVNGLQITAANAGGTTLSASVNLTGSLSVAGIDPSCKLGAVEMILSGTASVQVGTLNETLTFNNTAVRVEVSNYSTDCVPLNFTITLNGSATLTGAGGAPLTGDFTNFIFTDDTRTGNDVVTLNGAVDSACFGNQVSFQTPTSLSFPPAAVCPTSGVVRVTAGAETDRVTYTSAGVDIDLGDNGSVDESFASCVATELLACPAG